MVHADILLLVTCHPPHRVRRAGKTIRDLPIMYPLELRL